MSHLTPPEESTMQEEQLLTDKDPSDSNHSHSSERKRKVRNRNAQRNYRQSIKKRLEECDRLREEVAVLKQLLALHTNNSVCAQSPALSTETFRDGLLPMIEVTPLASASQNDWSVQSDTTNGAVYISPKQSVNDIEVSRIQPQQPTDVFMDMVHYLTDDVVQQELVGLCSSEPSHKKGLTAALQAATDGNDELLALLMRYGADLYAQDETGCTPLHMACQYGHEATVQRLLNYGGTAALAVRDENGLTPFHTAVKYRHLSIVKLLLELGADVNARF